MRHVHPNIKECLAAGDSGDPWGTAMTISFAICSELWWRGEDVPHEMGYSPGAAADPREEDGYEFQLMVETPTEDLQYAARVVDRYVDILKARGEDY